MTPEALSGPGFAVFTRSVDFAVSALRECLTHDSAITHVLFVPSDATDPPLTAAVERTAAHLGREVAVIPWEEYATPAIVTAVSSLPSEGLAIVLPDQRRTLGNRLDVRRTYMRRKAARKRIVIDVAPYEVFPWKVYFPFAFFDRSLLGYHHSYAIEQDYERFTDGQLTVNPCDPATIAEKTWRVAVVDPAYARGFFTLPAVTVLPASAQHHAEYATYRDALFENEKSIASVKTKLARWVSQRYPARDIPHDLKRIYEPTFTSMVHTDLPFDRWLANDVLSLMRHTNALLTAYLDRGATG